MNRDIRRSKVRQIRVCVVIPAKNAARTLERQIEALQSQTYNSGFKIVVADNGSEDSTGRICERYARATNPVTLVDASTRSGANYARYVGSSSVEADLYLFCDADDIVHSNWVEAYLEGHQNGADFMGGNLLIHRGPRYLFERGLDNSLASLPFVSGSNFAVSSNVLKSFGGIPYDFDSAGEDADLSWRLQIGGFALTHCPLAKVNYTSRTTLASTAKQHFNYGRGQVQLYKKYKDLGMYPKPIQGTLISLAKLLGGVLFFAFLSHERKFRVATLLGAISGRVSASIEQRIIYV